MFTHPCALHPALVLSCSRRAGYRAWYHCPATFHGMVLHGVARPICGRRILSLPLKGDSTWPPEALGCRIHGPTGGPSVCPKRSPSPSLTVSANNAHGQVSGKCAYAYQKPSLIIWARSWDHYSPKSTWTLSLDLCPQGPLEGHRQPKLAEIGPVAPFLMSNKSA